MTLLLTAALITGQIGPVAVEGEASWYCSETSRCTSGFGPSEAAAAIDPSTGFARGDRVRVTGAAGSRVVTIVDTCACGGDRIIDLYASVFIDVVGPLSRGIGWVTVEGVADITLPATDTEPLVRGPR